MQKISLFSNSNYPLNESGTKIYEESGLAIFFVLSVRLEIAPCSFSINFPNFLWYE